MTQIKQHTLQSGERILLFEMPLDCVELHYDHATSALMWDNGFTYLPTGNWQLIGISDEMTEEQAKLIVDTGDAYPNEDRYIEGYAIYSDDNEPINYYHDITALESFKSLMHSLGCDGRYAVLRERI